MAVSNVSIIIPVLNEQENLVTLYAGLKEILEKNDILFEIIFIDDGSTDNSYHVLEELHKKDTRVKVIQFRKNFGKAAAISAGFEKAVGEVVFTMDADLQDNPKEIPNFLEKMQEGYDLVSGWKKKRYDPLAKRLTSRIFNKVVSILTHQKLHDINCGFKAYRKEVIKALNLYGELHRFIPIMVGWEGYRIGEIEVEHSPRRFGKSKYGAARLTKGFFDLITILLLTKYSKRPLHFFGTAGLIFSGVGFLMLAYLVILWFLGLGPIGTRPLLVFGVLLVIFGIQVTTTGLIGEIITRASHKRGSEYSIKKLLE
jgi:glycosyltransferase involved in cell wall biosynthesis